MFFCTITTGPLFGRKKKFPKGVNNRVCVSIVRGNRRGLSVAWTRQDARATISADLRVGQLGRLS